MLDQETQRRIHRLENELLVIEEEKRHLGKNLEQLRQDERIMRHTLEVTQKNLDQNKAQVHKDEARLAELEDQAHHLKTEIKNQHD
jgi:septation ring formation regulator EzrA